MIFPSGDGINGGCFYLNLGGMGILDGASLMCLSQVDDGHLSSHYFLWTILKSGNHSYLIYELLEVTCSMENLSGNQITRGREWNRRLKRREGVESCRSWGGGERSWGKQERRDREVN